MQREGALGGRQGKVWLKVWAAACCCLAFRLHQRCRRPRPNLGTAPAIPPAAATPTPSGASAVAGMSSRVPAAEPPVVLESMPGMAGGNDVLVEAPARGHQAGR